MKNEYFVTDGQVFLTCGRFFKGTIKCLKLQIQMPALWRNPAPSYPNITQNLEPEVSILLKPCSPSHTGHFPKDLPQEEAREQRAALPWPNPFCSKVGQTEMLCSQLKVTTVSPGCSGQVKCIYIEKMWRGFGAGSG